MFISLPVYRCDNCSSAQDTEGLDLSLENLPSGHVSPPEHTATVFPGSVIEEDQKKNP